MENTIKFTRPEHKKSLNVPPGDGQLALLFAPEKNEAPICRAGQSGGAGNHVEGVIIFFLPQMVDKQDGDT